jgi:K+-sensing histidine kinase KdpD
MAKSEPAPGDARLANFLESVEDARTVFAQVMVHVRTVQDYDRFETGQLVPHETGLALGEVGVDVVEELQRHAVAAEKSISFARPPVETERKVQGDRELLRRAILNLGMSALRRAPARGRVLMSVVETDVGSRFRVAVPGETLQGADRLNLFEPYAHLSSASASASGFGLGLALARAVVELHEGHLWIEDLAEGGCAIAFELKWQRRGTAGKRSDRVDHS